MSSQKEIQDFLGQGIIAVAGVSRNKNKFGSSVYKDLKAKGYKLYPVNPNMTEFEGDKCYPSVKVLPEIPGGLVISVSKNNSLQIVKESFAAGVTRVWFQNGAESEEAIDFCINNNMSVIHNECILMFAQPRGFHKFHKWVNGVFGKLPA